MKRKKTSTSGEDEVSDAEEQVDFDFGDPGEADFHIIKSLVQRSLDGQDLDSSALSDLIIDEAQVSSVIRCSGDCIGIGTVLPLSVFGDKVPIEQTKEFWRKKVQDNTEVQEQLAAALKSSKTGVLISERVLNAPPELAPPLMAGLAQELKMLADLKPEVPESKHGQCQLFLHCATAYVDSGARAHDLGAVPVTASTSKSTSASAGSVGDVVFIRPEDEFMHKHAKWSHKWNIPESGQYSKHSKRIRILMAVPKKGFLEALREMAQMFEHDLSQHGL